MEFTVSNQAELVSALEGAQSGDVILLAAGNYGEFYLQNLTFDAPVTIRSADPDSIAVFDSIRLWNVHGMTFDEIKVDFEHEMDTTTADAAFRTTVSSNITISNSVFEGGPAIGGIDPDSEPGTQGTNGVNGYPVAKGIWFVDGENMTVTNTEISEFSVGVTFGRVDGLTITDNYIHDLRGSPVTGGDVNDVLIEGNHFTSSHPWNLGGLGDHGDQIHIYATSNTTSVQDNIVIRDNFFEQGSGEALLGIYIDDNNFGYGFTNVVIENNVLHNGDLQGIRFENVDGAIIRDNTFLPTNDDLSDLPGIVMVDDTRNVLIENNVLGGLHGESWDIAGSSNISQNGNLFVQSNDPFGENYVGDLFLNPLVKDGDITDFMPVPGSLADGVGALLTQWGAQGGETVTYVSDVTSGGTDIKTHTFSVETMIGPDGPVDLSGASVSWDFGDGGSDSGPTVSHEFGLSGDYTVTATITLPGGDVFEVSRAVQVLTLDGLTLNFEDGFDDLSDEATPYEFLGTPDRVASDYGQALRLDGNDGIMYEGTAELINNPEYSISLSFTKESLSDDGHLMYFSGTGVLSVNGGTLSYGGTTDTDDRISLRSDSEAITDTDWHHVTMTFSGETGTAELYLDGILVDEQTGLTGRQYTTPGHDLTLGGRFGGSFVGLIDNVSFIRGALDAEQVADLHGGLMGVEITPLPDNPPTEEPPAEDPPADDPAPQDPPAEDPPVEEPSGEDDIDLPETPRGEDPPEIAPVEKSGFAEILSSLIDALLSIFGLSSGDSSQPAQTAAAMQIETEIADIIPITELLDDTVPSDPDEGEDDLDLFAA